MSGLEVAAISLGTSVVQSAVKLWLGDRALAADIAKDGIDALSRRASGFAQQRATRRLGERMAETVAAKIEPFVRGEIGSLPEHEWSAALDLVRLTFERAAFTDEDLFAADLDAAYLDRHLPDLSRDLSTSAAGFYLRLRRECCAFLVQTARSLPEFQPGVLTELLRRDTAIVEHLEEVLARLPEAPLVDFELDYRRQVGLTLDHMELFGATLTEASRRYPLRLAYVDLALAGEGESDQRSTEEIIGAERRLLIRGEAGGGKTTLLRWIAVRAALRDLPSAMADLRDCVPFSIPLRQFVDQELPAPADFLVQVGRHIADEMPRGWVQRHLRTGRAVVLIDGVDELPEARRRDAHAWVRELIQAFPQARYVVTSRPGAIDSAWLAGEGFVSYELQPMSPPVIRECVAHWHEAVAAGMVSAEERDDVLALGGTLAEGISRRGHLRLIASSPLLCALLCALNRDRHGRLPGNRMELYDVALDMLLERRGTDQGLVVDAVLSKTVKTLFLQDIAYWMARNGKSDAPTEEVTERVRQKMLSLTDLRGMTAEEIYRHLLERSGLLREPVVGRVDFVHRTFQEYLAALEAVSQNDIGFLVDHAHEDQWRETVVMAAGHAFPRMREELLWGLLGQGTRPADENDPLADDRCLLALACLETSPELPPALRKEIQSRAETVIPPRTINAARAIVNAGDWALDLLAEATPTTIRQMVATIRAASEFGTEQALRIIAELKNHYSQDVQKELLRAWDHFNPAEYARNVIRGTPLDAGSFTLNRRELIPALGELENLHTLRIGLGAIGDLDFVRELSGPQAVWLDGYSSRSIDFSPLIASKFTRIGASPQIDARILRDQLSVFRDMPGLESLEMVAEVDLDLTPLGGASITDLRLDPRGPSVRLGGPVELPRLSALHLGGFRDLDLATFLAPVLTRLEVEGIRSLRGIERFPLLRVLRVSASAVEDIGRLAGARSLESLVISGPGRLEDVAVLGQLPALRNFSVDVSKYADLDSLKKKFPESQVYDDGGPRKRISVGYP
ncbi:NACHT domain-containing protein [Herbidospora cretacea]|uniref:NACHT domain-containing protein n=1 Tax=Herbidospora cretacea TaxID=28444 RepID=UPI000774B744|nr:NACHT domain-containing protein [Herbidospora cretacea]